MKYYFAGKSKNQQLKKSEKSNKSTRFFYECTQRKRSKNNSPKKNIQ